MNAAVVAALVAMIGTLLGAVAIAVWQPMPPPMEDLGLGVLAGVGRIAAG